MNSNKLTDMSQFLVICFICLTLIGCKSQIQREAENQSSSAFEKSFANCNGFWFTAVSPRLQMGSRTFSGLTQIQSISFAVTEMARTEADKLNGIEYKGGVELIPKQVALRSWDSSKGVWGDWQSGLVIYASDPFLDPFKQGHLDLITPWYSEVTKKGGTWKGPDFGNLRAPDCSAVTGKVR